MEKQDLEYYFPQDKRLLFNKGKTPTGKRLMNEMKSKPLFIIFLQKLARERN